jgi:hypothetical protein
LERIKTTMAEVARDNLKQDYLRERERSEIFHKKLWDELHKECRRREEAGLEEDEPEELIGTKGPRPRM